MFDACRFTGIRCSLSFFFFSFVACCLLVCFVLFLRVVSWSLCVVCCLVRVRCWSFVGVCCCLLCLGVVVG